MIDFEYTGVDKVPIFPTIVISIVSLLFFIKIYSTLKYYLLYLPIPEEIILLALNITTNFLILYFLTLIFIKIRIYKKTSITLPEKYIVFTFNEIISIITYNLDKGYLKLKEKYKE